MLWLAGLMGLFTVGALGVIDLDGSSDDEEQEGAEETGQTNPPADESVDVSPVTVQAGDSSDPQISGTDGNDILYGSDTADWIEGGAGDDIMHGENGADTLSGGEGNDTITGGNGDDILTGGAGDDALQGSDGDDLASGGDGNDAVQGGLGSDTLSGGAGSDTLFGGWGDDLVNGVEDDPDTAAIEDTDDADYLNGGGGNDTIIAGNDDIVTSGEGADTIVGGSWITDGNAIDIVDFDAADDNILLIFEDETDIPDISLVSDPQNPEITQVFMDGFAVANILNGASISIEDISVMPLSLAQSAGMAPA